MTRSAWKQLIIDVTGLVLIGLGLPLLLWFLATQDIGPVIEFFR